MTNIIDIGSNSVRLLSGGKKTVITTRLAENMKDNFLDEISMDRTANAIMTLCNMANGPCLAFATEAVRKAKNKSVFLNKVHILTGLKVDVISGEEEAEISYLGATFGYSGSAAVIDLGGASCEIVFGNNGNINYKASFPFGCVTMYNTFGCDRSGIYRHVENVLCCPKISADSYIAVGGTATSLAAMAQNLKVYDPSKVDGYSLSTSAITELIEGVMGGNPFPTLSPERRKTIAQGGTALLSVLNKLNQSKITISEKDNLEGYMLKHNFM